MSTIKIIYWSGTYNTKTMAELIREGVRQAGSEADLIKVADASREDALDSDILLLGCPAMGDEVVQQSEMEPFIASIEGDIKGKKLALFGSYGWGDGKWMRDWEERMKGRGAELVSDSLIVEYAPSDDSEKACIDLGKKLGSL